ncbi:MAG: FkbM family methyltransferase [Terrimicrobiaceae bacterium]|nr:FkbM family methyltransferase [Terrimicrobiaceae bacterium]
MRIAGRPMKAPLVDRWIAGLYRRGWLKLAAALLWQAKGHAFCSLIQWTDSGGMVWMLNPNVAIDLGILTMGRHDPEIFELLSREARPGDVLWDIGANIGCLSLPLARKHPSLRVVAFEPSPAAAHQFTLIAALNNIRACLVTAPLADALRCERLHLKLSRNSGQNSLRPWDRVAYDTAIHVLCDCADHLAESASLPFPNLVKLDVEQFEEEVLAGMPATLARPELRLIVFECMRDRSPGRFLAIRQMLEAAGCAIEEIPPQPGKPVENFAARRGGR